MSESKSYLDTFNEEKKPESFSQEKFEKVPDKSGRRKVIAIVVVAAILLAAVLVAVSLLNHVRVPDLAGMSLEEANVWATQNRIVLAVHNVYNFDVDSGMVISQEIKAGSSIAKNTTLLVEASLGADPDEKITWPDIKTMVLTEIEKWIDDNKLTGVKISTANSDVIEADHVVSYSLTDDTEENFVRKSRATVVVSLGPATQSDTVVVSDFSSMKTAEIVQWGKDNGVTITLSEAFDDYISAGSVVSQSIKADTEILKSETLSVVISKGKPIAVPDFSSMTQDEASTWAKNNNIALVLLQRYSADIGPGVLMAQDVAAGAEMQQGDELKLTYSLGHVEVASFVGRTKLDILNWQTEVNAKGADIVLSFSKAYGEKGTADKIIRQSPKNDTVDPGAKIRVTLSLGMKLLTPDFSGKTENECKQIAQQAGIVVLFNYEHSDTVAAGLTISQNPAPDTIMNDANPVTVTISY
jgi:beta-lactam-binding protein with PASTA domain